MTEAIAKVSFEDAAQKLREELALARETLIAYGFAQGEGGVWGKYPRPDNSLSIGDWVWAPDPSSGQLKAGRVDGYFSDGQKLVSFEAPGVWVPRAKLFARDPKDQRRELTKEEADELERSAAIAKPWRLLVNGHEKFFAARNVTLETVMFDHEEAVIRYRDGSFETAKYQSFCVDTSAVESISTRQRSDTKKMDGPQEGLKPEKDAAAAEVSAISEKGDELQHHRIIAQADLDSINAKLDRLLAPQTAQAEIEQLRRDLAADRDFLKAEGYVFNPNISLREEWQRVSPDTAPMLAKQLAKATAALLAGGYTVGEDEEWHKTSESAGTKSDAPVFKPGDPVWFKTANGEAPGIVVGEYSTSWFFVRDAVVKEVVKTHRCPATELRHRGFAVGDKVWFKVGDRPAPGIVVGHVNGWVKVRDEEPLERPALQYTCSLLDVARRGHEEGISDGLKRPDDAELATTPDVLTHPGLADESKPTDRISELALNIAKRQHGNQDVYLVGPEHRRWALERWLDETFDAKGRPRGQR
jgi:hypothetical protein